MEDTQEPVNLFLSELYEGMKNKHREYNKKRTGANELIKEICQEQIIYDSALYGFKMLELIILYHIVGDPKTLKIVMDLYNLGSVQDIRELSIEIPKSQDDIYDMCKRFPSLNNMFESLFKTSEESAVYGSLYFISIIPPSMLFSVFSRSSELDNYLERIQDATDTFVTNIEKIYMHISFERSHK